MNENKLSLSVLLPVDTADRLPHIPPFPLGDALATSDIDLTSPKLSEGLRSCVLEKATFLHKAKWNNLCLVLKPHCLDVREGLWVWGDSRNSVSIALYKWLPDVFVPTFFFLSWPPFQEMDWRSWQLIKNRFRVRKTNTHSAKLKSPHLSGCLLLAIFRPGVQVSLALTGKSLWTRKNFPLYCRIVASSNLVALVYDPTETVSRWKVQEVFS